MRQNFVAQFIHLLKQFYHQCDMQLGIVMEKNWALSVSQCWLQVLQFSVHLIHFAEHTSLRCNGFARIRKAVMDQLGSRPPDSDDDSFWV